MSRTTIFLAVAVLVACRKSSVTPEGGPEDAGMVLVVTDTGVPDSGHEMTAKELADAHRDEMAKAAEEGRYADVCAGTPKFPSAICAYVAARARGKEGLNPGRDAFYAFINREHIKKVSGTIVMDTPGVKKDGRYEAVVYGYRRRCVINTFLTEFKSGGAFSLWVQEQPETEDVELKSGGVEKWVVLEENDLGKDLSDLTFSHGVEAQGVAKDLMKEIANFVPYSELKGEYPDAGAPQAMPATTVPSSTPTTTATPPMTTATPTPPPPVTADKAKARADCMRTCIAGCKDDSACEMDCSTKRCVK
jgi:hypothetical protein